MTRYRFYTADVFTAVPFAGNPLAVLPDARGLHEGQMQRIAREFNLSETAFVFPAQAAQHTRRVRIFTPRTELPFAGHPTLGTAYVLAVTGEIPLRGEATEIVFEEGVGPVPVTIYSSAGQPTWLYLTAARRPEVGPPPPERAVLAEALSLNEAELQAGPWRPAAVSCGVPFLFVPLRDRAALGRATLRREVWARELQAFWAPHLYLVCFEPEQAGADLRARLFAPALGVEEDPATGAAAAALAGYLGLHDPAAEGLVQWTIEQGVEMGRPSLLKVQAEARQGQIVTVRVGGQAVLVSEGTLQAPG